MPGLVWFTISDAGFAQSWYSGFLSDGVSACPRFLHFGILKYSGVLHECEGLLAGQSVHLFISKFHLPRSYLCFCALGWPHTQNVALCRVLFFSKQPQTVKIDRTRSGALKASLRDKINLPQTKIALHRTRLRFLDRKNFSVLFSFKSYRQTGPALAALR